MSNDLYSVIAEKLRWERERANITQKELGARCGMSRVSVSQYEVNSRRMSIESLYRFAQALQIPVSRLLPDEISVQVTM